MNGNRRKRIQIVINGLNVLLDDIQSLLEEEQNAFDALPESLQEAERGELMQEAIDNLDAASSSVEEAVESLESAAE